MTYPVDHLARLVAARMRELGGMTITELARRADVSPPTIRNILNAAPREDGYRMPIQVGVARALEWEDDAFDRVALGLDPEPTSNDLDEEDAPYVEVYPGDDAASPRSPETRLASACDNLGAGLSPLAERLGKIAAEGIDPGPPATEAVAALDKLLARLGDFSGALEDLRNEIVGN
ncbi:MAG: helix-turn-helix transcriptional regulator [Actinomycetota bacterium]